jgi:alpha-galactosidase/6-phospho-beta-glucosidase family protein
MRYLLLPVLLLSMVGCAQLKAVQVNDIDQTRAAASRTTPVKIRLDQSTLNTAAIGNTLAYSGSREMAAAAMIAMVVAQLSSGDAEGRVVLRSNVSGQVDWIALQEQACPGGYITNLRSISEYDDYLYLQYFKFGFDADCIQPASAATAVVAPKS